MADSDVKAILKFIKSNLYDVKIQHDIPEEFVDQQDLEEIVDTIKTIRESALALGSGNLSYNIAGKGYVLGSMKNLQASLRNLTWKTKAISSGDFTQNVDFLGEFSDAFNSMTRKLETSIQEVKETKEHFELVFHTIPDPTIISKIDNGEILGYNKAFLEFSGYNKDELESGVIKVVDFYLDTEKRQYLKEKLRQNGFCQNWEINLQNKNKEVLTGLISSKYIHIAGELHILSVIRDITHLKEIERKLVQSEERHRLLADNASDVIWIMDLNGQFTYISPSVEKLRGYTAEEVKKQKIEEVLCPESLKNMKEGLESAIENVKNNKPIENFRGELEQPCKDGTTVWTDTTVSGIYDEKGDFKGLLGVTRDISKRKKMEEEIIRLSITDKLTQVYNRLKIDEVLIKELERTKRNNKPFCVIMLDIDHFKLVNDTYGHQVGDYVLVEIANILKGNIRSIDIIGRWGGEEFFIILPETDEMGGKILAEKLRLAIQNTCFKKVCSLTVSFGVAAFKNDTSTDSIVSRADNALYRAKEKGRNRVES